MKTLLVTGGREIVKQISNGRQELPLLMKDRTDYQETYEKWVTNSDQKKNVLHSNEGLNIYLH